MSEPVDRLRSALADRYEIDREVGSGGMATVYLATDVRHERRVALKVLRPELAATLGPERFLQEVRVTANLQHPHILPLFDSGEADGFLFYVMPYIEGESLRDRLAREGELPVPEAARLLRDVVDALGAAHAMGVVHRDIKPENILVSGRHALVTDFGVAKAVSEATGRHRLTTMGVALGTPTYMAPEQAAADTNIDHRADIYAVGAVAYELLTGHPPFTGRSPQQLLSAHVTEAPRPVTEARSAVPAGLETLVMRCLEKKPADRWQRAEEMLPVLETFATPSAGITPTGMTPVPQGPSRSVPWAGVGAAAGVVAALAAAVWLGAGGIGGTGTAPAEVDPDRVAVVPFRVSGADPSLAYLREGMVDLLSVKLSGSISAVEPRTVLDAWRRAGGGDVDPPLDAILDLAAGLGAGRALLGSAVGSPGQLTLSASLYEAPRGRELATASVTGRAEQLPDIIDRLTAQMLSLEAGESQERLATLTTTSLPALRAYLDGMASYRRGLYREATESFVQAVRQDSTFALAALYIDEANAMLFGGVPGAGGSAALVRAHRDRLGPRDRAYSLAVYPDSADGRDALERWEAAMPELGDRPEAWYHFGDRLFHFGARLGVEGFLARSKEAFSRSVALDSTYFAALHHLIFIAEIEGDTAFALEHMRRYLESEQSGYVADLFHYDIAALTGDDAALQRLDSEMESLSDETLMALAVVPGGDWILPPFATDRAMRAADILLDRAATPDAQLDALDRQHYVVMNAGRPARGEAVLSRVSSLPGHAALADRSRIHAAVYWDGEADAAEGAARRLRGEAASETRNLYAVATWDLAQGRMEGIAPAIARLRAAGTVIDSLRASVLETRAAHAADDPSVLELGVALEAELLRGRGTNEVRAQGNLTLVELFEAQGDPRRALAASRRVPWNTPGALYASTFTRARARLSAATGDTAASARAYDLYLRMRPDPEPRLQPEANRIRAELAELRAGSSGP